MSRRLKLRMIFLLVFCVPGFAIVGYSIKLAANTLKLTGSGVSQTGIIVKYERPRYQGRKARLGASLCSVVQFNHDGLIHTFTDDWCSKSPKNHPLGSAVPVIFDPGFPANARINHFWELHGASVLSALIGAPWLLIGLALVVRVR
ncbi:MAG: DUF3592 domain-containing protein [Burkholderiaceae bacterium]